jgi:hypothetical protein
MSLAGARLFFFVVAFMLDTLPTPDTYTPYGIAKAAPAPGTAVAGREWELYITSSTPDTDLEGERVQQEALKMAAPYYLAKGRLTFEHITNETRLDPSMYVGEPIEVKFPSDGLTLERGWLYQSPYKPKARRSGASSNRAARSTLRLAVCGSIRAGRKPLTVCLR